MQVGLRVTFFPLSVALAPTIEALAVQYPGRQERRLEKTIDNIPELAGRISKAMESWVGRPYALFGHSMGAILAFEVACRLQRQTGISPVWLFASGRRAPSRPRQNESIHLRDDAGILAAMMQAGGTDLRILGDEEVRAMILPAIRSDYKAIDTYSCAAGQQVNCPITVLVGDSDPQVTIDEAAAWSEHSDADFDLRVFPGGHFYLETRRAEVIATISAILEKVRATSIQ